ncbi:IS4 family transposase [Orrella sp. 11846]|uniref:IS4 family transposase n=1 Tax=Orrella sp. 11846 TaxID=3409913 RepID=UPI003B5B41D0
MPHEVLVYLVMCLCLYRQAAYEEVLHIVIEGLRRIYGDQVRDIAVSKGAISIARTRVGPDVFESLYRSQVKPCAPAEMSGCWYRGLRVVGLDGSTMEMPEEKSNAAYYGHPGASRGAAAFPRLRFCTLAECGTHTLFGARMGPYKVSEHELAKDVLQDTTSDMIVLADRGFTGYDLWQCAQANGARLLFRARDSQVFPVHTELDDGSYLTKLYASPKARRRNEGIVVRIVEYRLGGSDQKYRLVTNWLEHTQAPAEELAALYHRRWRIEVAIGELKTHLWNGTALRSKTPDLVCQEFYALLIAHAAIRKLMTHAAQKTNQTSEDLSFIHAVQVLRRRLPQAAFPPSK